MTGTNLATTKRPSKVFVVAGPNSPAVKYQPTNQERLDEAWQTFISGEIKGLFRFFYIVNSTILGFIAVIWASEHFYHPAGLVAADRLVTTGLLQIIIGATTTQLGLLVLAVGTKLFRGGPR